MTAPIVLEVVGIPHPQGDKSAVLIAGRPRLIEGKSKGSRQKLDSWRVAVADAARAWLADHPQPPLAEPLRATLSFRFPLPKSDPYRTLHVTSPDLDKITRATFDSLKHGALIADDSLICSLVADKRYCAEDEAAGCTVTVESLGWFEAQRRTERKASAAEARRKRPAVMQPELVA